MTTLSSTPGLSSDKQELLRRRLQGKASRAADKIPPRPAPPLPLSPVQHSMWVTNQFLESTALYNVPRVLRITGHLDADALRHAIDDLVARHEILRTTYPDQAAPIQVINPPRESVLRVADLADMPEAQRWEEALRLAREEIATPFDLTRSPVLRALLISLGGDAPGRPGHVLVLNTHHIASDDWSCTLMLRELDELYSARTARRPAQLPALPVQYADYAAWQSDRLASGLEQKQLGYWRAALSATPHVLEMPTDFPRPAVPSHQGGTIHHDIDLEHSKAVRALAADQGVTVYTVLLACFACVLRHYSGQDRFAVGSLISGRLATETEPLLGLFANAVALPMDLRGGPAFYSLLRRTHETVLGAFDHQDVTFEQVVASLKADRAAARNPVYQTLFQCLEAGERVAGPLPGMNGESFDPGDATAKVDLTLTAMNGPETIHLMLNYATDLFTADTAHKLVGHMVNVVDHATAHPGRPVPAAAVLGPDEHRLVTREWAHNGSGYPRAPSYPLEETVIDLFRARARSAPRATAVTHGEASLAYGELDALTDRIARGLHAAGAGRSDVVGVALPRGAELVAAVLGVLKAGAAYLPLDTSYPPARLDYMLQDVDARLVIVDTDADGRGPADGRRVRYADLARTRGSDPLPGPGPADLAYVMYTSGSTGRPKGVDVAHRGLTNLLSGAIDLLGSSAEDRWLLLTSLNFDPSTLELFIPLITGARIVVAPESARLDGAEQCTLIREQAVTHIQATPTGWRILVGAGLDAPRATAITVGEVMPAPLARQVCARTARLINAYGPTEITVYASYAEVRESDAPVTVVGRPAANCQVYLLDENLEPVPAGAIGEVCIGGGGIAWGYHGQPGLTARRFVPAPYGPPGSRVYRSGDRGRFLPGGELELRGRADHQVKIRGHRVEPGEVEAMLLAQPTVDQAAVVARPGPSGGLQLAGYVVARPGAAAGLERALRDQLSAALPAYLVPARIAVLDRMPLTATGKVDRASLPDAPSAMPGHEQPLDGPRTEPEQALARVWTQVLGLDAAGREQNFFESGGDSVLAIHLTARARDVGLVITPRQVLTHQTLAELAAVAQRSAVPVPVPSSSGTPPEGEPGIEGSFPLSPLQAGMLFHTLLDPDSADYIVQVVYDLEGDELEAAVLRRAWEHVCGRHQALRTTFAWDGLEQPMQVVHRTADIEFRELDWADTPMARVPARLADHLARERDRGFDLRMRPPQRLDLIRLANGSHRLIRHAHHILLDGWSVQQVAVEVETVYRCLRAADTLPQLPEPVPFGRYIEWLRGRDGAADDEYWRGRLGDVSAPTPLAILGAEPGARTGGQQEVATVSVVLPTSVADRLNEVAREHRMTVGSMVHAAWALLLSRYSGTPDALFGSTVSGRSGALPGAEHMVGMLINTLPVRVRVRSDQHLADWIHQVHAQLVELRDYEHCSLTAVQRHSQVPTGSRMFETILMFENFGSRPEPRAGMLRLTPVQTVEQTGYPLVINVGVRDGVRLRLDYQPQRIAADSAQRLLDHYRMLLESFAVRPEARVGELAPLPAAEWNAAVREPNDTGAAYPSDLCLHELFEQQADRTPEAVAVLADGDADDRAAGAFLTYRELDERANRLARWLRELGAGPETLVGICFERGLDMTVGLLGVLKSGAAYVPLDPDYPAERLAHMIADTAAPLVVTHSRSAGRLPSTRARLLLLDDPADAADVAAQSPARPPRTATVGNLAYVIYTSGSTGRPKGTMIRHQGIVNYLWWMATTFPLAAPDRVLQLAGLSFDISVYEMFWPWACGATTVLARPDGYRDPQYIADAMIQHQITSAHLVPSMLRALLPLLEERRLPLRQLFASAEALTMDILAEWKERCPGIALVNLYGATEVSVDSTFWVCDPAAGSVSVGHPIANTRVHVLDTSGQPVPIGVPGEACLAGDSVGRGYHGCPGLTARRFTPDPLGPPGSRLYRTGDLVRRMPGGALEFLGRLDHQVKIRGFRVELGEIEASLVAHPRLAHAAVIARDEPNGPKRLVAYVAAKADGPAPTTSELRAHLRGLLPEYMIPGVFVALPALPLNPNGKVDRHALPEPEESRPELATQFVAPRTRNEQVLAQVWSEVLGVDGIGVHDNFFELGGDSILSIRVMVGARREGLSLTPRQMFAGPTIAELARAIEGAAGAAPATALPHRDVVEGEVPLTAIQRWFVGLCGPASHYNQSVRLRWNKPIDEEPLRGALGALAEHHDALRLRLDAGADSGEAAGTGEGGARGWRQHVAAARTGDLLAVADLSGLEPGPAEAAARQAADELHASLDLRAGPVMRALLLRYGHKRPDELVLTVHHMAVDTVSWDIVLEDLTAAYQQLERGEPCVLPAKTTAFSYWAERLAAYARSDEFAAEAAYWRDVATTAPVPSPIGDPGRRDIQGSAVTVTRTLDAERTEGLLRPAHAAYRTGINDLLITALAQTLAMRTGRREVHIDLEGHGREPLFDEVDLSRTVGWFTSIHPLRLQLPDPCDDARSVRYVREYLHGTPQHGIGYGLARYLRPGASWDECATAPVSFNYHGQVRRETAEGLFTRVSSLGTDRADDLPRPYQLEFDAAVIDGVLTTRWTHSADSHDRGTVDDLADQFIARLTALTEHCLDATAAPTARGRGVPGREFLDRLFPGVPATALRLPQHGVPGLGIALIADGAVADEWGEGASCADGAPVRPDTVFQAGSVSKHVTTLAVMRLVQDGVLDLDADLSSYLRSWRLDPPRPRDPVSLRMLLSHTAGLTEDEFDGEGARHSGQPIPAVPDILDGREPARTRPVQIELPPGKQFRYSGNHFLVVEQVLCDVTGVPFPALMRELVFDPLGMRDSGYGPAFTSARATEGRLALGHHSDGTKVDGSWRIYPDGTGGLWASAGDIGRIAAEIQRAYAGQPTAVLDKASAVEMLTPAAPGVTYGLGTILRVADGIHWYGHSGEAAGYRCYSAVGVEPGTGIVLTANGDAGGDLIIDLTVEFGLGMQVWVDRDNASSCH